ncbi:MAG TPA: hypothetical protein VMW42_06125 [Desulfatiglandales bacterium]|nr:hypothetical protein [Desulfatiglandales bacterium]
MPKLFEHDESWFAEVEEGKTPQPGSPAYRERVGHPRSTLNNEGDFWPTNPHSLREMQDERMGRTKLKDTIRDPVLRRMLDLEEE